MRISFEVPGPALVRFGVLATALGTLLVAGASSNKSTEAQTMSNQTTLYDRNRDFAADYDGEELPGLPRLSTIILTCVDHRIDPALFLGLQLGDAVVLRNAGGRVDEAIERDLAILSFFGSKASGDAPPSLEMMIIHHTQCGVESLANPVARKALHGATGIKEAQLSSMGIADHMDSLHDDIQRLRQSPRVSPDLVISGHLYDVRTGRLEPARATTAQGSD